LEKRLQLVHLQNTVHVSYRLLSGEAPVPLILRPLVHFRPHDAPVNVASPGAYRLSVSEDRYELCAGHDLPPLRMILHGQDPAFTLDATSSEKITYRVEEHRGDESSGELWSPGYFRVLLAKGCDVTLVASTESWENIAALGPEEAGRDERRRRFRLLAMARRSEGEGIGRPTN
jgi:hypothetical protein